MWYPQIYEKKLLEKLMKAKATKFYIIMVLHVYCTLTHSQRYLLLDHTALLQRLQTVQE